jgi:hypothetical protein
LTLPPISDSQRLPEVELWVGFEHGRPGILGALFDIVAHGLARRSVVRCTSLPRMADFALWTAACETALWPVGTVTRAYGGNRQAVIESVIDSDPVAACARNIMVNRDEWAGTASDFLLAGDKLQQQEASIRRRPDWPRTPRALASRLRRAQSSLRAVGIDIAFHREGRERSRMIRMRGPSSASPVSSPTSVPPKRDLEIEMPP